MERDPVCGMEIRDLSKAQVSHHNGKKYYFCSELCKTQFEHDPEKFIKKDDDKGHMHHHH